MNAFGCAAASCLLALLACSSEGGVPSTPNGTPPDGGPGQQGDDAGPIGNGPGADVPRLTLDAKDTPTKHLIATGAESATISLAGRAGLPADATGVYVQAVTQYDPGCGSAEWEIVAQDVDAPPRLLYQEAPSVLGKNAVWLPLGASKTIVARVPSFKCTASVEITVLGWAKGVRFNAEDAPTQHNIPTAQSSVTIPLTSRASVPADADAVYVQAVTRYPTACGSASWELGAPDTNAPPRTLYQRGPLEPGVNAVWMPLGASRTLVARVPGFACSASVELTVLGSAKGLAVGLSDATTKHDIVKGAESVSIAVEGRAGVPADATAVYVQAVTQYDPGCGSAEWEIAAQDVDAPPRLLYQEAPFELGKNAVWLPLGSAKKLVARVPNFACGAKAEITVLGWAKR